MTTFIEENCTITHEGQEFTSGGAWLCDCSDGYRRGVVYAKPIIRVAEGHPAHGHVTDWHGNKIADAMFGVPYRGNFCMMRSVAFELDGIKYTGRYAPDSSEAVRVRSTKRVA